MNRTLEPELMDDPEQALIYAQADFKQENQGFVDRFREYFPDFSEGHVVDLGCGPGDIPVRFARVFPSCRITGVDASAPMVRLAEDAVQQAGLSDRIHSAVNDSRTWPVSVLPMPPSPTAWCIMSRTRCSFGTSCD